VSGYNCYATRLPRHSSGGHDGVGPVYLSRRGLPWLDLGILRKRIGLVLMTVYVLIFTHWGMITGVKVSAERPEVGLTMESYLLYECVVDSADAPKLIEKN
jgi:hypothetical protein